VNNNGITAQTDVFQAGMTLFRMLVGLGSLRDKFTKLGEQQYYQAICDAKLVTASDFPPYVPARVKRIVLKAINPNVADRYASALEMRRDLEKLNYSGYWTIEPSGSFVGHTSTHEFRFEHNKRIGDRYDVVTFKKSKATQRETRFTKFCASGLTRVQSGKRIEQFVKSVVEGK
jgi:hypothetical protein